MLDVTGAVEVEVHRVGALAGQVLDRPDHVACKERQSPTWSGRAFNSAERLARIAADYLQLTTR